MNESIVKSLLQLFAVIVAIYENKANNQLNVIREFLKRNAPVEEADKYENAFIRFFELEKQHKKYSESSIEHSQQSVTNISSNLNDEFDEEQKFWILLQLLEFIKESGLDIYKKYDILKFIAGSLHINLEDYENSRNFILAKLDLITDLRQLLIIDNKEKQNSKGGVRHMSIPDLKNTIIVLNLKSVSLFLFKYFGDNNFFLNSRHIHAQRFYALRQGGVIRGSHVAVYNTQIASKFHQTSFVGKIRFTAENISFKFGASIMGINKLSFSEKSGSLVGVVGGSGTGKSTLLNVFNGKLKTHTGQITINGYDIYKEKKEIEGIIGYVPQDDLLIEEFTVWENLYYNTKLCFANLNEKEIDKRINSIIYKFDLIEARNLKVGNPINKQLSGGQRKRLNIALEIMREPYIMFLDEPTSGLSSADSERIIHLLKRQTHNGKLIIANIHQPSSDMFKMFDRILILDQGGRLIYNGHPNDALVYFKKQAHYLKANESECLSCGNISTELILRIIEARVVNEFGQITRKRKISPEAWEELYKKNSKQTMPPPSSKKELPNSAFQTPNKYKQFIILLKRNIKTKLKNKQYMLISLLEAPILAFMLSFFTQYSSGTTSELEQYTLFLNDNIPSYLFMSIVIALFLGMSICAEDIIKDRKIRARERFLNISWSSYINSKIITAFILSALQMFLFVIIANSILEIEGLTLKYWLILFSTTTAANLIGLNLSASLNSVVSIYIIIPFILVFQLLFSGIVIDYNKMNIKISSRQYTPIIGDLMLSRWSYEALAISQFRDNRFNKHFFEYNQKMNTASYNSDYYIPFISEKLEKCKELKRTDQMENLKIELSILKNELRKFIIRTSNMKNRIKINNIKIDSFDETIAAEINLYLKKAKKYYAEKYDNIRQLKDDTYKKLSAKMGGDNEVYLLKQKHHNKQLEIIVRNLNNLNTFTQFENNLIQLRDPIYKSPDSNTGRAHFYAPYKKIANVEIDTFKFNLFIIWVHNLLMYFALKYNIFRKIIIYIEKWFVQRRQIKRLQNALKMQMFRYNEKDE